MSCNTTVSNYIRYEIKPGVETLLSEVRGLRRELGELRGELTTAVAPTAPTESEVCQAIADAFLAAIAANNGRAIPGGDVLTLAFKSVNEVFRNDRR